MNAYIMLRRTGIGVPWEQMSYEATVWVALSEYSGALKYDNCGTMHTQVSYAKSLQGLQAAVTNERWVGQGLILSSLEVFEEKEDGSVQLEPYESFF